MIALGLHVKSKYNFTMVRKKAYLNLAYVFLYFTASKITNEYIHSNTFGTLNLWH